MLYREKLKLEKLKLEKLKNATSIQEFAPLLDLIPKNLAYLLFKLPAEQKYQQFTIPKKSGGERKINAPQAKLKLAQRRLANILNSCVHEIESNQTPRRQPLSHGFKKKAKTDSNSKHEYLTLGIHTNAKCHRNKRYVLNLDLADFFPSFNFGRVRGFFISNNHFNLHPAIATIIAQIACHQNELPQGSPCSPIITNLITHILDVRLTQQAKKYGCTYSRYADDITFSTNQKILPEKIAIPSDKPNQWIVGSKIEGTIERAGFKINQAKTRLQLRPSRQVVTGLVVNKKVNIKSEYYRYARSMCHALFSKGAFFLPGNDTPATIRQLEGILSHIQFIKEFGRTDEELFRQKLIFENAKGKERPKLDAATELYSRFLYFCYFVALEKPLIMCEGKTDAIYLKAAIRQLEKKNNFKFSHAVDFFPFTRRVSKVMRIHDGASALKSFIEHYAKSTTFKFETRLHPVIVLLDNDKEAKKVIDLLSKKFTENGIEYDQNKNFAYHVISNLYVVLLPKQTETTENKIEDFFYPEVLKKKLKGKTFSAENGKKFDNQKHYSKQVLATKIVRPRQDGINFKKFQPILELISQTINKFQNNYAA